MIDIDLILYNGTILTIDKENSIKNWVAVHDGRIVDIGVGNDYKKYLDSANEAIDLSGKALLPGFYDNHVHLVQTGLNLLGIDASQVKSVEELLEIISNKAKTIPSGRLIRVIRYDESKVNERRFPTRYELDCCAPNNPVWINRIEYHTSVVNSLALHMLNLPFNLDGVVRNDRNLPDGRLTGKASALVRNQIYNNMPDTLRKKGVDAALNYAIGQGVTSLNALEGGFTFHDKDAEFIHSNKDTFPIDITLFYQTVNVNKVVSKNLPRIGGCIFLDGSFGSRTAALSEPYSDDSTTNGKLYFTQDELNSFVLEAHKKDLQITVHAIGDMAIDQILNAYEYAQAVFPRKDHRHRIEHFELPSEDHINRAAKMGIIVSTQPAYEYYWGGLGDLYEARLGAERCRRTNPLRSIINAGVTIVGGSDSDVTPINPILGIHMAVNHPTAEQAIDILEAIKMYTINGAKAVFEENIKGSIEVGKYGDFVLLDKNPFEINKENIKNLKVMATIKEGNILFI